MEMEQCTINRTDAILRLSFLFTPSQGGVDNKKGHQHLTHLDMRTGIPLMRLIETESMAEIRLLCTVYRSTDCRETTSAIHVVERAFIDAAYWDKKKFTLNSTLIYPYEKQPEFHLD